MLQERLEIKAKNAWQNAGRIRSAILNKDPNEIANKLLNEYEQIEILPGRYSSIRRGSSR
jgi:hypothetical protein